MASNAGLGLEMTIFLWVIAPVVNIFPLLYACQQFFVRGILPALTAHYSLLNKNTNKEVEERTELAGIILSIDLGNATCFQNHKMLRFIQNSISFLTHTHTWSRNWLWELRNENELTFCSGLIPPSSCIYE